GTSGGTGAEGQERELVHRRKGPEERRKRRLLPDERAVGRVRTVGQLGQQLVCPRWGGRLRRLRERGEERRGECCPAVRVRDPRRAVLERDRPALFGHFQAAGWMPGGLREDRRVRRAAAAPCASAASVKDGQLEPPTPGERRECLLRTEDLPLGGQ